MFVFFKLAQTNSSVQNSRPDIAEKAKFTE